MKRTTLIPILAAAMFVALLAGRIWTYASGQDSATYMGIARGMQQWIRGEPVLTHHMGLVAPAYPVLLALVREVAGPLAAYWVNPVIGVLWLVLAARMSARFTGDERQVFPVLLMSAAVAFLGYGLFPHFALYPFRSPLMLVLMFVGFLLVHRAAERSSPVTLVGGWFALLFAGLTREFALIGWMACGFWWWGAVRRPARFRWTGLALFFGPVLIGGVSAPLWLLSSGSKQISDFVNIILRDALARGWPFWWNNFSGICRGLYEALGVFGLACLLLGCWHTRANRAVRWLVLAPGLFLAFAYTPFLVHQRYMQEALAFLAILAGIGLGRVCAEVRPRCPPAWQPIAPWAILCAVAVVCIAPPLLASGPVFGRVTSTEIRDLLRSLPPGVRASHSLVIDPPEGRLWEVLQANTSLMCLNASQVGPPRAGIPPAVHVMESVNGQGWNPKKLLRQRSGRALLLDHYDLRPWPEPIALGGAEYRGWSCLARTGTVSRARFPARPGVPNLLFFDAGPLETRGRVLIMDRNGIECGPPQSLDGELGWTALLISPASAKDRIMRMRLEAEAPVPADLGAFTLSPGRAAEWSLGVMRRASTLALFDPASRTRSEAPYGVLLNGHGVFTAPALPPGAPLLNIAFRLRRADTSASPLRARLSREGTLLATVDVLPLTEADAWLGGVFSTTGTGRATFDLQVDGPSGRPPPPVWVTAVRMEVSSQ